MKFPPGFHPGAPPPHDAFQNPPGRFYGRTPQAYVGHQVYPGADPPIHYGAPGHMGGPGGVHHPQQSQAGPPGPRFHVGAGDDLNYMGGMHNLGAMLHAAEACGHSNSIAVQRNSSLNASSATITKMSWTDFQKYASVSLLPGSQCPHGFLNGEVLKWSLMVFILVFAYQTAFVELLGMGCRQLRITRRQCATRRANAQDDHIRRV